MTITPAELTIATGSRTCPACGAARKGRGELLCWPCHQRLPQHLRAMAAAHRRARAAIGPALAARFLSALGAAEFHLPERGQPYHRAAEPASASAE